MRVFENHLTDESGGVAALRREERDPGTPRKLPPWVVAAGLIAALALVIAGAWMLWTEKQILTERLNEAGLRVNRTEAQINTLVADMGRERLELMQAHQDAARAKEDAAAIAAARAQAEQERGLAREEGQSARLQAEEARSAADEAQQEKKQIREERLVEIGRLQHAMSRIVKTAPAAWGLTADLGSAKNLFRGTSDTLEPAGRELLGRVAGALLASPGYRVVLALRDPGNNRSESALLQQRLVAVTKYLMDAGVPGEILSTSVTSQARQKNSEPEWLSVQVIDTILPENRSVADAVRSKGKPAPEALKSSKRGV